jgi:hypothetical protein
MQRKVSNALQLAQMGKVIVKVIKTFVDHSENLYMKYYEE